MSALIFLGILAAFVLVAFVVSRITGGHAYYLEDWKPEDGETALFEDREADTYIIPKTGQARFGSYARLRRGFVLVTDRRLLAGQRPLFSKKQMIQYVMHVGSSPDPAADSIGGALLSRGYQTFVLDGTIQRVAWDSKPYVELTPSATAASSFNIQAIRIYTDRSASFPLPARATG